MNTTTGAGTMTTHIATITEQQDNWSELTVVIYQADSIDAAQEMDDWVDTFEVTTSAYTGLDDLDGNVDFDQLQFMADIEAALAPEWVVTDWIASHGDSGSIIGATVTPAGSPVTINPNITGETDDWEPQISEVLQDGEVIGWICRTPAGFTSLATSRAPREPWAYNYAVGLGAWHAGAMTDFTRRVWHPTGEFTTKRAAVAALTTRKNEVA